MMANCNRFSLVNTIFFINRSFPRLYNTKLDLKQEASVQNEIIVPYRIKRGPTDILKALASTISKDYTAPQYKYEDDPYFIPASNITKRTFALSKEAGKKAARYFLEKEPNLFKCNESVPHIKAFDPPVKYTEKDNPTEITLKECVREFDVENSINVYNILKKKDCVLNQELKQDLLELLCFYNCDSPPIEDYYEERYFRRNIGRANTWKLQGLAEQLFNSMEKDCKAYSTMICGTSKFFAGEKAFSLYEERKSKNIPGTLSSYNSLLLAIPLVEDLGENRWQLALSLLDDMVKEKIMPDLYTMNALLEMLWKSKGWKKSKNLSLSILSEMKRLKIEPSLATYYYILMIFYSLRQNNLHNSNILEEIITQISGQEFIIKHPNDVMFFSVAMEICWKFEQDKDLAYRIHDLVELQNNCKFLGNAFSESLYFKSFFRLLSEYEDIDKFMEIYNKYIPNTYTPEPDVTLNIINAIHMSGIYKHLPRICSDILLFEQTEREKILSALFEAIASEKHEKQLQETLVEMVSKIIEKNDARNEYKQRFQWNGELLDYVLKIYMNGADLQKTWSLLQKLKNAESKIIGYPNKETLIQLCLFFIGAGDVDKFKFCVKYAVNSAFPEFESDLRESINELIGKNAITESERILVNGLLMEQYKQTHEVDVTSDDTSSSSDEEFSSSDEELSSSDEDEITESDEQPLDRENSDNSKNS